MSEHDWNRFSVGAVSTKENWTNPDCVPFDSITHTSHVGSAISIIENGEIRKSLVFDKSKLNKERILVSWLSPNSWSNGYRYGNIQFSFPFSPLIKKKNYYWVESIAYKIPASRILITDEDRDGMLERYDPKVGDGPWWFNEIDGKHYYNGTHCLEFMFESNIGVDKISNCSFVDHHSQWCSIHSKEPTKCKELRTRKDKGGALFISRILAGKIKANFITESLDVDDTTFAISVLISEITKDLEFTGIIRDQHNSARGLTRAILSAYSYKILDEARSLASLFENKKAFTENVMSIIDDEVKPGVCSNYRSLFKL